MKRFFHKSFTLILFASVISFVLTSGIALIQALKNKYANDLNDSALLIFIVTAEALLLLLNTVDIIDFWLRGKLEELKVKQLLGISRANTLLPLYLNLNLILLFAFLIGAALTAVAATLVFTSLDVHISPVALLLSFAFCTIFLNIYCTLLVPRGLRKCGIDTRP